MNTFGAASVLGMALMAACTCATPTHHSPAQSDDPMQQTVSLLREADVQSCLENGGAIALVRVERAGVLRPGTRGEQADVTLAVVERIHGALEAEVRATRYTSGGHPVLTPGRPYIVALGRVQRFAPRLLLEGFVEVPDGREAAFVEAHRQLLTRLGY